MMISKPEKGKNRNLKIKSVEEGKNVKKIKLVNVDLDENLKFDWIPIVLLTLTLVFALVTCTILLYFATKEYDEDHSVQVRNIPYYVVQDQDSKAQTSSKTSDFIFPMPNLQFLYLTFRNDLWNDTMEEDQFWNGFVAKDAIIEDGAVIEKGAFVFPKAVIRANATGYDFRLLHFLRNWPSIWFFCF